MTESTSKNKRSNRTRVQWLVLFLLVATGIGFLLKTKGERDAEYTISPTFTNLAEGLFISDAEQQRVHVIISGSRSTIDRVDPTAIHCRIDLSGLRPGSHIIHLTNANIDLPNGAALRALLTPSIALTVEKHPPTKEVKVVAVLQGHPAPGYAVADIHLQPDRIVLKGPASKLASIETVKTRPIDLEAAKESFKREIPLDLSKVVSVTSAIGLVIAQIDVRERIVTRVIENLPVSGKGLASGFRIDPGQINLTIRGPESVVKTIENDPAFAATVDLTGMSFGIHVLKAAINLPVRVTLIQAEPEQFHVEIIEQ